MTAAIGSHPRLWTVALALEAILILALLTLGAPDPKLVVLRWGQLAILSVAGIAGWSITFARPTRLDPRLSVALLLAIGATILSAAASPYPSLAWSAVWQGIVIAGTALLLWHQAASPTGRRNLLVLLAMLFAAVVAVYLAMVAQQWLEWLRLGMTLGTLPLRPGNIGGFLPIPTWFGDSVVVLGPLAVVGIGRTGPAGRRVGVALAALALVAIVLSGTRSIWILLPVGGLIMIFGTRPHLLRRGLVATVAVVAVAFATLTVTGLLGQIARDVDEGRSSAFGSALQMLAERPLLGGGPGTYGVFRLGHDVEHLAWVAFPSAHNVGLNTLAELGVIGSILVVIAGALLVGVARARAGGLEDRDLQVAAIAGLAMLTGHAMVDVVFEQPGLMVLALAVAGFAVAGPPKPEREGGVARPRALAGAALALGALLALPMLRFEWAVASLASADAPGTAPADAVEAALKAVSLAPDFVPAWTALASREDAVGNPSAALQAARTAADLEGLAQHRVAVAWLLERAGDPGVDEVLATLRGENEDPFVLLNVAVLGQARGWPDDELMAVLARLIERQPDLGLVDSRLPRELIPILPAARTKAVDSMLELGQADGALIVALTAGEDQLVSRVIGAAPDDRFLAAAAAAWRGSQIDVDRFEALVRASPRRTGAIRLAWLRAASGCAADDAERWRVAYQIQFGSTPVAPVNLGVVPDLERALRPTRYPETVWKVALPARPYVNGSWVYALGEPSCP